MKILLINPPAENELIGNNPPIVETERGFNPPLGLLYVASSLEKYSRFQVRVLDCQAEKISYSGLPGVIQGSAPDLVGITAMTFTMIDVVKTVGLAKEVCPNARVVLGGIHPFLFPDETINIPGVDFLILGEGEFTFPRLLENADNPGAWENIPGLVFRQNGKIFNTGRSEFVENLDDLPFPARHLTPVDRYGSILAKKYPVTTMITSRGCPYSCSFCSRPHLGKKYRARSAVNVADEFAECQKLGIKEILVYDDLFTLNRKRVLDICREIIDRKIDLGFEVRTRPDCVDDEMLQWLKKAGCRGIHYGVEAGTEKILKNLGKGINMEDTKRIFELTKKIGLSTLAYFMVGSPGESKEDIRKTIRFARKLDPDFVHVTILTPFPDTEIYRAGLQKGLWKTDYWREFAGKPIPGFQPPYWEKNLSRSELIEMLNQAYRIFYLRPRYILKQLMKIKSGRELKNKIWAGLKIFRM